jgi:hypothetical protein
VSVNIKDILLNKTGTYKRGDSLIVTAVLENMEDKSAIVYLEGQIRSQAKPFPILLRQAQYSIARRATREVVIYELEIDSRFLPDIYTAYVSVAGPASGFAKAQKDFRVKTLDALEGTDR